MVGSPCFGGGVVVDVDDPIEEGHDLTHDLAEAYVVERGDTVGCRLHERAHVDRTEIADRGLVLAGDLDDLGAQVGEVHHAIA